MNSAPVRVRRDAHIAPPDRLAMTIKVVVDMILVTRINKVTQFYVNEDMIEFIEETPDTILSLNTGKKIAVMETAVEIIEKIREEKIHIRRASQF